MDGSKWIMPGLTSREAGKIAFKTCREDLREEKGRTKSLFQEVNALDPPKQRGGGGSHKTRV